MPLKEGFTSIHDIKKCNPEFFEIRRKEAALRASGRIVNVSSPEWGDAALFIISQRIGPAKQPRRYSLCLITDDGRIRIVGDEHAYGSRPLALTAMYLLARWLRYQTIWLTE